MKHDKTTIIGGKCHPNPCPYCAGTMITGHLKRQPTRDHIFPKSRFPMARRTIIVCSECNFMKADMTLSEFIEALRAKNKELAEAMRINRERIENISYLINIGLEEGT